MPLAGGGPGSPELALHTFEAFDCAGVDDGSLAAKLAKAGKLKQRWQVAKASGEATLESIENLEAWEWASNPGNTGRRHAIQTPPPQTEACIVGVLQYTN